MKLSSSRGPGRGLFLDPDYFDFYILKISDEQFEPFFEIKKTQIFLTIQYIYITLLICIIERVLFDLLKSALSRASLKQISVGMTLS